MYPHLTDGTRGVAAIGSITAALKAQRVLASVGLTAEVISLLPSQTRKGCAYGLEFALSDEQEVRSTLRAARIAVSQYLRKGGQ